jgi:hypothetical protein
MSLKHILRSWTPDNRVTDIPSLTAANLNVINAGLTDRFVKKADFFGFVFFNLVIICLQMRLKTQDLETLKNLWKC